MFQIPMNLVLLKNISIVGLHWGAYTCECQSNFAPLSKLTSGFSERTRPHPQRLERPA